jgi:hypothetical protein
LVAEKVRGDGGEKRNLVRRVKDRERERERERKRSSVTEEEAKSPAAVYDSVRFDVTNDV